MGSLEDLAEMYQRLKAKEVPISVFGPYTVSIGVYFSDPDGNGLESTTSCPAVSGQS